MCYKIGTKPILNHEIDQESTAQQNTTEDHTVIENHPTVTQKEIRDVQVDDNSFVKETDTQDDSFNGDKILEDCSGQPHSQKGRKVVRRELHQRKHQTLQHRQRNHCSESESLPQILGKRIYEKNSDFQERSTFL
jgi:hypothetical protein